MDGSFKSKSVSAAIAFIVKNDQGRSLFRQAKVVHATSAFQAEVLACLKLFLLQFSMGSRTYLYSRIVCFCFNASQMTLVPYFLSNVFEDIRFLVSFLSYCHVTKVPRTAVQEAH